MKLEESETFINLARAYTAECQARIRYEFAEYGFRYNGYEAIAQIIDKIAYQEFNHARMLYTYIQKADLKKVKNIDICAGFPFKEKWDLENNLKILAQDEQDEADAYSEFIKVAEKEGFDDIAKLMQMIMDVELRHRDVFNELYSQYKNGKLYKKSVDTIWYCPACGHFEIGKTAWEECPLCGAKQGVCEVSLPKELII